MQTQINKTKKIKTQFICNECGYFSSKWLGKCPDCGTWNSFVEEIKQDQNFSKIASKLIKRTADPIALSNIESDNVERTSVGISEVDRILGGGLVKGSFVLLGGAPGIGKSTILLQLAAVANQKVLYVSGEESLSQIKLRATRLGVKNENIFLIATANLDDIQSSVKELQPDILIVDSIQTIYNPELINSMGTVTQIKDVASNLLRMAKSEDITIFLAGHITKEGALAGPKILEHMVDVVLYFEDDKGIYRIIRSFKNRFGNTSEIAVFEMSGSGLIEVKDPDKIFHDDNSFLSSGSVLSGVVEGSRALNVEIQALVTRNGQGIGRRQINGIDVNRLFFLLAVLEKRLELNLYSQDVFVNLVGGMKVKEISLDVAVCAAIISSYFDVIIPSNVAFLGEIGLGGEIRSVNFMQERIKRLMSFGVETLVIGNIKGKLGIEDKIKVIKLNTVKDLLKFVNSFSR